MVDILFLPLLACVLLAGIHCHLGIHVLARGIIFVDLALAQMAGLGLALAMLSGHEAHSGAAYLGSLAGALTGAALFALVRPRNRAIPQEAVIGIVYGVAAAIAVLLLDRAPHGQEGIKSMLIGNILFVSESTLWQTLAIYAAVGAVHFAFRRTILLISIDPAAASARGVRVWAWDLLFYASFALVVTSSVQIAGVLLVFTFLVVPAVAAMLFCASLRARLIFGWSFAIGCCCAGLYLSFELDLPTGAALIATFGGVLAILAIGRRLLAPRDARQSPPP